jgi:hypothetical protein
MVSMKLALIEHKEHHHEHEGGLLADIVDFEKIGKRGTSLIGMLTKNSDKKALKINNKE